MTTFEAEWRARFERFGRSYAEEHFVSGWSPAGLARRFSLFEQLIGHLALPVGSRVLELGCGAGTYVRRLAELGHSVVGIDYALPSLGRAVEADPGRKGRYLAADGHELPFTPECFDLVVCIGVLQAVSRPGPLLDEMIRVLRPEGLLVVEALNALEIPALARRLSEIAGGRRSRVRHDSPFEVCRALEQRKIRHLRRVGVYLLPRRFPRLGRILDSRGLIRLIEMVPGGSLVMAHAFWYVGRKSS